MSLKILYGQARQDISAWTHSARDHRHFGNHQAARVAERVATAARRRYIRILEREIKQLWTPKSSAQ